MTDKLTRHGSKLQLLLLLFCHFSQIKAVPVRNNNLERNSGEVGVNLLQGASTAAGIKDTIRSTREAHEHLRWIAHHADGEETVASDEELDNVISKMNTIGKSTDYGTIEASLLHVNDRKKRIIRGEDDRRCNNFPNNRLPYSPMGALPGVGCTGFLIAPHIVLTAGHCVYDFNQKQFRPKEKLSFYRGVGCHQSLGTKMDYVTSYVFRGYALSKLEAYDIGIIVLNKSQEYSSHFGITYIPGNRPLNVTVLAHDTDQLPCLCETMCKATPHYSLPSERILGDPKTYCHTCDTTGGSSGAPIILNSSASYNGVQYSKSYGIVTGIAIGGRAESCNVGVRFTREIFDILRVIKCKHGILTSC